MSISRRIYAYTGPGQSDIPWSRQTGQSLVTGTGRIKVGETTRPTAAHRIKEQTGTMLPGGQGIEIFIDELASRTDGSGTFFRDHDVHRALKERGIRRVAGEWFEATVDEVRAAVVDVRHGRRFSSSRTSDYPMRPEQEAAVVQTAGYIRSHAGDSRSPHFLWNAKMRFGKTFTTYQLAREMGWTRLLVLTFKPAVQDSWKSDLTNHVDFEGWQFVDRTIDFAKEVDEARPIVGFASFQDLRGRTIDGQIKGHNEWIHLTEWDCIVLDEYHYGAWRDSARELYDQADASLAEEEEPEVAVTEEDLGLDAASFLYLSGTPFRALTDGEFTEDAVFNWTYIDEQSAKSHWDDTLGRNPYTDLPKMEMYTYVLPDSARVIAEDGEFDEFSLNEYFRAKKTPDGYVFNDPTRVTEFLNMLRGKLSDQMKQQILTGQKPPFPYESAAFVGALDHTVWYMADVAACHAMAAILKEDSFFKSFEIVVAAGARAGRALEPVKRAIAENPQTITLSCGKLMTGVTVPQWASILMLRSLKSPESYFQAAFRVQSPWSIRRADGELDVQKDTCYVFEFDPNRALGLIAEYGVKLATTGDLTPREAISELVNYLPIFAFDGATMLQMDAAEVLDWASAGVGATALANRWNSDLLVDVNEYTLMKLLEQADLLEALNQIEDFRNLVETAQHIVTSTKALKKAKRDQGGVLTPEQKTEQSTTGKQRKEIRDKLKKFLASVPVFMYLTDFREEALKHVIESLDPDLFEKVTGLTVADFKMLSDIGLFNAPHMNHAIYQFKRFEEASLNYVSNRIGLWDRTMSREEFAAADALVGLTET